MLVPGETFGASYPAVPESVATARKELTDFARRAGGSDEQLQAVRLAASEAVTNAVLHAYDAGDLGVVTVSASYVEDELWVLIGDAGRGMRVRENSPGLGLGLALIAQMSDEFEILSRGSGGTELRMRFTLASERRPGCSTDRRHRLIRR
jgi:serine/threonine-protein kinase RsbW